MPNTYTQLYVQVVFAVKFRKSLIVKDIRVEIQKYISGIIANQNHKLMAIYAMPDHCHILIGLNPKQSISDLVREIKSNSSKWINEHKLTRKRFQWQEGYGAFSYAERQVPMIINYILNQETHHKKQTFREEYLESLEQFEIAYDEKYLFEWIKES